MFQRFILSILAGAAVVNGFSGTLFQEHTAKQIKTPCVQPGIEIELPDFDELFFRIQQTSPLARSAMGSSDAANGKVSLTAMKSNQGKLTFIISVHWGCGE